MSNTLTAIKSVSFYIASPVECCDRCGQGIKYVSLVTRRDGSASKYGMDCIEKVLKSNASLLALFRKNTKLLKKFQGWQSMLALSVEEMPHGSPYFDSGLSFIGNEDCDVCTRTGRLFHPLYDAAKNARSIHYAFSPTEEERWSAKCMKEIESTRAWHASEITRMESFLASILARFPDFSLQ